MLLEHKVPQMMKQLASQQQATTLQAPLKMAGNDVTEKHMLANGNGIINGNEYITGNDYVNGAQ